MIDYSVYVSCKGVVRQPKDIIVQIENWGPEREFHAVIDVRGTDVHADAHVRIARTGSKDIEFVLPASWSDSPSESIADLSVVPDGSNDVCVRTIRFTHLPYGWFDRTDPDLTRSLCDYCSENMSQGCAGGSVGMDIEDVYGEVSGLRPMEETPDRFFRVASPAEVSDFGDCTESEAAILFMDRMVSRGHRCCLVRLGAEAYVGSSGPMTSSMSASRDESGGGYVYVRPSDGCNGIPLSVTMDRSYSRVLSVTRAGCVLDPVSRL